MMKLTERIARIDPDRITVDTVRMLFPWTPRWMARLIMGTGVRRGEFAPNPDGSLKMVARGEMSDFDKNYP